MADKQPDIAEQAIKKALVPLPQSSLVLRLQAAPTPLSRVLCARRSIRAMSSKPVPREKLEKIILDSAGGVKTAVDESGELSLLFRTIPQAGGISSVIVHLVQTQPTNGLDVGCYRLCPISNSLHKAGNYDEKRFLAAMRDQTKLFGASSVLIFSANFQTKSFKYQDRGYRFCTIECGCGLQNALVSAQELGLCTLAYGAYDDDKISEICGLNIREEAPITAALVGLPPDA